jgi:hypothetical protein
MDAPATLMSRQQHLLLASCGPRPQEHKHCVIDMSTSMAAPANTLPISTVPQRLWGGKLRRSLLELDLIDPPPSPSLPRALSASRQSVTIQHQLLTTPWRLQTGGMEGARLPQCGVLAFLSLSVFAFLPPAPLRPSCPGVQPLVSVGGVSGAEPGVTQLTSPAWQRQAPWPATHGPTRGLASRALPRRRLSVQLSAGKGPLSELAEPHPGVSPRYIFFGGKGGVGKTSTATATAVGLADQGLRTLVGAAAHSISLMSRGSLLCSSSTSYRATMRGVGARAVQDLVRLAA